MKNLSLWSTEKGRTREFCLFVIYGFVLYFLLAFTNISYFNKIKATELYEFLLPLIGCSLLCFPGKVFGFYFWLQLEFF